jgi:hypothetical protein
VAIVATLAGVASPAMSAGPTDEATAAALFQEAKKLVAAGDFEHACPKFDEAQRLFPTTGTLLNIGNCYEKLGKLATAWGAFKQAEVGARNHGEADREQEASKRAQALAPQLPKLAIVVPPAARVPGFELRRDGELVGEAQYGTSLPIDPGNHTVEATAPGHKPWSTMVRVEAPASAASIAVPPLDKLAVEPATGTPASAWNGRRIAGVAVGSIGIAGLLTGAIAGGVAASKVGAAKSHCQPMGSATACDPMGLSLRSDARPLAKVSDVGLAVGGSALVAGVVLFATAPAGAGEKPSGALRVQAGPAIGAAGAGFSVEGAW